MEIDELDYERRPFNNNKLYEIHSLSSHGFTQYINHDSYTHKYLEMKAPKRIKNRYLADESLFYSTSKPNFFSMKKMYNENENVHQNKNESDETSNENNQLIENTNEAQCSKVSKDRVTNRIQQLGDDINSNDLLDLGQIQAKTLNNFCDDNLNENKLVNFTKNTSDIVKNNNMSNNKKIMLLKPKNLIFNKNSRSNKNHFNKLTANLMGSDYYNSYSNLDRTTKSVQKTPSVGDFSISTHKSVYFQKSNLDPLSRRLNITTSNFRKTINRDTDTSSNFRFDQNYMKNLNLFVNSKSYFNMDKIIESDSCKKPYDGFQSYNVPHFEKLNKDQPANNKERKPLTILTEKIAKSCVGNKKISMDLTQSPEKIKEVQEENEKLRKIIMLQTSSEFLNKNKLPEIQYCVSQPKLRIKKNDLVGGKIKHMGGKYNPYNFQAGRDCETNRRNKMGALFQH